MNKHTLFSSIAVMISLSMLFTGCEKQEIVYEVESRQKLMEIGVNKQETDKDTGDTLKDKFAFEEMKWQEEIASNGNSVKIKAPIIVPDARDMYTVKVTEHYPDNEDKKALIEKLFDEGTVKVNVNKVPTAQWADKTFNIIDELEKRYSANAELMQYCAIEKEKIKEGYSDLPQIDSISADAGDYSANHYIGTCEGIEYTLDFFTDPTDNRCLWQFRASDRSYFHDNAVEVLSVFAPHYSIGSNECIMGEEEAISQVDEFVSKIGYPHMKTAMTATLTFGVNAHGDDYRTDFDGYYCVLSRQIEDTLADASSHYIDIEGKTGNPLIYDGKNIDKPYDSERMIVEINDRGIISVICSGWMDEVSQPEPVKLLSFNEVKEKFRTIIKENATGNKVDFTHLYLTYVKVREKTDENTYTYTPVWRLNRYDWRFLGMDTQGLNYYISATDGSRIIPSQTGDGDVVNPDDFLMEFDFKDE